MFGGLRFRVPTSPSPIHILGREVSWLGLSPFSMLTVATVVVITLGINPDVSVVGD